MRYMEETVSHNPNTCTPTSTVDLDRQIGGTENSAAVTNITHIRKQQPVSSSWNYDSVVTNPLNFTPTQIHECRERTVDISDKLQSSTSSTSNSVSSSETSEGSTDNRSEDGNTPEADHAKISCLDSQEQKCQSMDATAGRRAEDISFNHARTDGHQKDVTLDQYCVSKVYLSAVTQKSVRIGEVKAEQGDENNISNTGLFTLKLDPSVMNPLQFSPIQLSRCHSAAADMRDELTGSSSETSTSCLAESISESNHSAEESTFQTAEQLTGSSVEVSALAGTMSQELKSDGLPDTGSHCSSETKMSPGTDYFDHGSPEVSESKESNTKLRRSRSSNSECSNPSKSGASITRPSVSSKSSSSRSSISAASTSDSVTSNEDSSTSSSGTSVSSSSTKKRRTSDTESSSASVSNVITFSPSIKRKRNDLETTDNHDSKRRRYSKTEFVRVSSHDVFKDGTTSKLSPDDGDNECEQTLNSVEQPPRNDVPRGSYSRWSCRNRTGAKKGQESLTTARRHLKRLHEAPSSSESDEEEFSTTKKRKN